MIYLWQIYIKTINYAVISLLYIPENATIEMSEMVDEGQAKATK